MKHSEQEVKNIAARLATDILTNALTRRSPQNDDEVVKSYKRIVKAVEESLK